MSKIFISCSSKDFEYVEGLNKILEQNGHIIWRHDKSILVGKLWADEIHDALSDVDAIIAIFSEASSNSNWVDKELSIAYGYFKSRGKPLILPILLDDTKIPFDLHSIQCIRSSDRDPESIAGKILEALDVFKGKLKAEEDERRENKERVEATAAKFIEPTINQLERQEISYRRLAYSWYSLAYITLILSVGFGVWKFLAYPTDSNWLGLVEIAISGGLIIVLLVALSKYAFTLGKSFMVESVRASDRRHAISFGEFYLKAYGDKIERDEVREVFQNWNIDSGSFFKSQDSKDFDPKVLELAIEIAKTISGYKENNKQ
jgi:TIR domain